MPTDFSTEFSYVQDVKLFHDKFQLETPPAFTKLVDSLHEFRSGFFREELQEYEDAVEQGDLGTSLDSLIDLVYIISGAALVHGIKHQDLYAAMAIVDDFFDDSAVLRDDLINNDERPAGVALPDNAIAMAFTSIMTDLIEFFDLVHEAEDMPLETRELYVKLILAAMFNSTMTAAGYQGCTGELWDELWADVQRANMSKVRAQRVEESTRSSTWDVVKPKGWVPPQTDAIIAKHQALAKSAG